MARLWSSGGEINSTTNNVEVENLSGAASISTVQVRTGKYSYRFNSVTQKQLH